MPPCLVGLEACGGAHYWARELQKLGHDVRLMAVALAAKHARILWALLAHGQDYQLAA